MFSPIASDHISAPRNNGVLETATHQGVAGAPGDGPYMILELEIAEGRIRQAAFRTYGCPAAIACGSMTTVLVIGRTLEQARTLTAEDIMLVLGGLPEGKEYCAQLAAQALADALKEE